MSKIVVSSPGEYGLRFELSSSKLKTNKDKLVS